VKRGAINERRAEGTGNKMNIFAFVNVFAFGFGFFFNYARVAAF
jgi:hypothetical protein